MMSQDIVVRLRSPAGLNRININPIETLGDLRTKVQLHTTQISKALNHAPTDFILYTEDQRQLAMDDRYKIKDVPILKNGVFLEARLLKAPSKVTQSGIGVNVDTIRS